MWPTPRISHWRVLAQARAIEDQAWLVACNGVGSHAGITLGGHSIVVDPQGTIIAEAGDEETILFADIEPGTYNLDPEKVEAAITPRLQRSPPSNSMALSAPRSL